MLQQTTVAAVRGRYEAFLERFPDLPTLADAPEHSVLAAWSGLGYYARARNLRRAAREVMRRHAGLLPSEPEKLQTLPGFGEYTAAAVASIAFGARAPAADANVTRALSRLYAIDGTAGSRHHARAIRERAAALLARGRPGDVTAALMDLGQLVCTTHRPACAVCPVAGVCAARRRGAVELFPRRRARPKARRVHVAAACAVRGRAALLVRRNDALLRGLWQFPSVEGATPEGAMSRLRGELDRLGLVLDPRVAPSVTRHTMVHRRLEIHVFRALPSQGPRCGNRSLKSVRWFTPGQLDRAAIPTLTRRIAAAAGFLPPGAAGILGRHANRHAVPVAARPR